MLAIELALNIVSKSQVNASMSMLHLRFDGMYVLYIVLNGHCLPNVAQTYTRVHNIKWGGHSNYNLWPLNFALKTIKTFISLQRLLVLSIKLCFTFYWVNCSFEILPTSNVLNAYRLFTFAPHAQMNRGSKISWIANKSR